jgi:predicted transcriptional regulator
MPTTQINFRVDEELAVKIDRLAEKESRTRTNMVIVLLKEALAAREGKPKK